VASYSIKTNNYAVLQWISHTHLNIGLNLFITSLLQVLQGQLLGISSKSGLFSCWNVTWLFFVRKSIMLDWFIVWTVWMVIQWNKTAMLLDGIWGDTGTHCSDQNIVVFCCKGDVDGRRLVSLGSDKVVNYFKSKHLLFLSWMQRNLHTLRCQRCIVRWSLGLYDVLSESCASVTALLQPESMSVA
jgi:hypothetical protein